MYTAKPLHYVFNVFIYVDFGRSAEPQIGQKATNI